MYERVLVPLDGSPFSEAALPRALGISAAGGIPLELIVVAGPAVGGRGGDAPVSGGSGAREEGRAQASRYLDQVSERIRAGGFVGEVELTVVPAGNVAHSLARHAASIPRGLVVMTTHGRGAIRRSWLGSTADGLIRRSPVPVLLIRPGGGGDGGNENPVDPVPLREPFRRVLLPLDGSEAAEAMPSLAVPLSGGEDAEVLLLRVVPPLATGPTPYLPHVVQEAKDHEALQRSAGEYLERVSAGLPNVRTRVAVISGTHPASEIVREAEDWGADLIAISTEGRGGVGRMLLGSVADKVIRSSILPVLVHRKPGD